VLVSGDALRKQKARQPEIEQGPEPACSDFEVFFAGGNQAHRG
jgi:hypothetical protein